VWWDFGYDAETFVLNIWHNETAAHPARGTKTKLNWKSDRLVRAVLYKQPIALLEFEQALNHAEHSCILSAGD